MKLAIKNFLICLYKKNLFIVSFNGIIFINLIFIKQFLTLLVKNGFIFLNLKNNKYFQSIFFYINIKINLFTKLRAIISKTNSFYHKKLNLLGIGFKSWVINKNKYNFYMLKIGFSYDLCYFIFSNIKFICLKPTLILIKSLDKKIVNQTATSLCGIKKWSLYKSKGIFYFNQKIKLKALKKN